MSKDTLMIFSCIAFSVLVMYFTVNGKSRDDRSVEYQARSDCFARFISKGRSRWPTESD